MLKAKREKMKIKFDVRCQAERLGRIYKDIVINGRTIF